MRALTPCICCAQKIDKISFACSVFVRYLEEVDDLKEKLHFQAPLKKKRELGSLPGAPNVKVNAGQLIEVLGGGPYSWVIQFLKEIPTARVAWIAENSLELFPFSVAQEKISLSRFLFLENVNSAEGFSRLLVIIRSGLFQIVIFDQSFVTKSAGKRTHIDSQLRKLQITAEDFGVVMVMLSQKSTQSFGVQIQVETHSSADGSLEMRLLKVKGRAYAD
jgi:hypothetical protein